MNEQLSTALRYVRSLGAGRILVGVLAAMLLGGPVLGLLAAANPGGVRTAVADAIRAKDSDDDEDDALLTPLPGAAGADGPDTSPSPLSTETPTMIATQAATPGPSATTTVQPTGTVLATVTATPAGTVLPTGTVVATVTATPTPTGQPTLTVCPSSPHSPHSPATTPCPAPPSAPAPHSPHTPS